ncbi:testis-expressed protein 47-like isoform X2 [Sceloporus undulatus]|uniref:testis-expressed protein 47-like isoform X2 n=1 Tax=Sceloporus undulatus TaxID=8520 RepID=UPI001C4DA80B|nr:testis-expressed protein 47-like isoform X2 [Sceloporus undulatus]
MATMLANIVTRSTLLSALEEKRRHQMKKYLLHRLFLVAMSREETQEGEIIAYHEQLFQRIYKFHLGEPASGVLIIYSNCILHIIEASSGTIYQILKDLATFETQGSAALLRDVKLLVMSHNIPTRLFSQWYSTKVDAPVSLEDVTQSQTTEEVITECLTLSLKLGVYLATVKVGNKGLTDCLHSVVPELLIPTEVIRCLCRAKECLSPTEFLQMYSKPLQISMDSEKVWPTPTHMLT